MDNENKVTLKDVLIITKGILSAIQAPITMKESVIDPVWNAICNLNLCIDSIENAESKSIPDEPEKESIPADIEEINGEEE